MGYFAIGLTCFSMGIAYSRFRYSRIIDKLNGAIESYKSANGTMKKANDILSRTNETLSRELKRFSAGNYN